MNKKLLAVGLLLLGGMSGVVNAQVSLVNPVPQQVEGRGTLFAMPKSWRVVCDKRRLGNYAVEALTADETAEADKAKFTVTLGVVGDRSVRKYAKSVPAKAEGYLLKIEPKGAVIAARDEAGLYYGVQTLLQIKAEGKLEECTVTDWPDVKFRGVVEGFYGTPWSHEARLRQLDFYGKNKMNVYIYGPKDDPWHRDKWRVPYPEAEGKRISELASYAKTKGVHFYWAIHPGVDIKWTEADRDALVAKMEKMYELGVRAFAVFFDDIWGEGTRADKQAELLNYVDDNFVAKHKDVAPLIMCPTEYNRAWANDEKGYLKTLGTKMNKDVEIMWTGNTVVHCIDKESMEWINQRINRKAYIWWNYPVSDFVRDRILLGPAYGNGLDIAGDLSGFVSNPMEHAEASKIALYGIADYTWNMKRYDYKADWEKAVKDLLPSAANALRTFAVHSEDLGPNGHGFRREESLHLIPVANAIDSNPLDMASVRKLKDDCISLGIASNILLENKENPLLVKELKPWLLQGDLIAQYGQTVCLMAESIDGKNMTGLDFSQIYSAARALQRRMYDLENSNVRHAHQPGIKLATKVLLPTVTKVFEAAVKKHNSQTGDSLEVVTEYNPFILSSTVGQLANLPIKMQGSNNVSITPALEVINWQDGGELVISADEPITLQGLEFNLGVAGIAKNFKLDVLGEDGWKQVSIMHYKADDPVIHTGNELGGMVAKKIRLKNISGKTQQVYFRSFKFIKQ